MTTTKEIQTKRFGTLSYDETDVILFPSGLVGLENLKHFYLFSLDNYKPLHFLQNLEDSAYSFILINPQLLDPSYRIQLSPEDTEALGLHEGGGILMYALLTIPPGESPMSINLLSPVVINPETRLARQVVMHTSSYGVAQPITVTSDRLSLG